MAYWNRENGKIHIKYYDPDSGKSKRLSRDRCRHLDDLDDKAVESWVRQWADENIAKSKIDLIAVYSDDEVASLIKAFLKEKEAVRKIDKSTLQQTERFFRTYILGYFVKEKGVKDVRGWQFHVTGFTHYLLAQDLSVSFIKKILQTLRQFSEYLVRNHVLSASWVPLIPTDKKSQSTPLPKEYSPQQIITHLSSVPDDLRLLGLIGYFASLRPAETIALTMEDFFTGEQAVSLCKTQMLLSGQGVGSRLSIHIDKQRDSSDRSKNKPPKTKRSVGYVAVWSKEGAREIASLLSGKEGALFPHSRDRYFKQWTKHGLDISLHDLRRSSALYLGRTVNIPVQLLQEHMRHTDIKTTMLYMRRPESEKAEVKKQDFSDVG